MQPSQEDFECLHLPFPETSLVLLLQLLLLKRTEEYTSLSHFLLPPNSALPLIFTLTSSACSPLFNMAVHLFMPIRLSISSLSIFTLSIFDRSIYLLLSSQSTCLYFSLSLYISPSCLLCFLSVLLKIAFSLLRHLCLLLLSTANLLSLLLLILFGRLLPPVQVLRLPLLPLDAVELLLLLPPPLLVLHQAKEKIRLRHLQRRIRLSPAIAEEQGQQREKEED